jgi:hypothetical protein
MVFRDWIEVEVLDARTGRAIAGYKQAECDDVLQDSARTADFSPHWGLAISRAVQPCQPAQFKQLRCAGRAGLVV